MSNNAYNSDICSTSPNFTPKIRESSGESKPEANYGCRCTWSTTGFICQSINIVRERQFDFMRGTWGDGGGGGLEDFLQKNPGPNFVRKKYLEQEKFYCMYYIIYK